MGWGLDLQGVLIVSAMQLINPQNDNIEVAAGIAVQSQWIGPWDTRWFPGTSSGGSGLGWAQVSDDQMAQYGLAGQDQWNLDAAYTAMEKRIKLVQDVCEGCSARDKLIAAALAQNGSGFTSGSMLNALGYRKKDGSIDWSNYFTETYKNGPSDLIAKFRQQITRKQYNSLIHTRFN